MSQDYQDGMVLFNDIKGLVKSMEVINLSLNDPNIEKLAVCLPKKIEDELLKFSEKYLDQIQDYNLLDEELRELRLTIGLMVVIPQNLKNLYIYYNKLIEGDFPDNDLQEKIYEIIGEQRIKYHTENGFI